MAAILKIVKSPYLSEKSSDFNDHKFKLLKFKMATAAILNRFLDHNSSTIVRFQRNFA